ncbi:hypothetical protein [Butyricimonas virosa]|uniref:hypothetical protein n=1 Tax=Butyricimonas virosa TaxID=544645 RepID=UPI0022E3F3AC|nr:hypothetical protein [Butyricimonas virosa]
MKYWKDLRVYVILLLLSNCICAFVAGATSCNNIERYMFNTEKWYNISSYASIALVGLMVSFLVITLSSRSINRSRKDTGLILLLWLSPLAITMIVGLLLYKFI